MSRLIRLLFMLALAVAPSAKANEKLSMVANGEVVGNLDISTTPQHVTVDYHVFNNGRGASVKEAITLDRDENIVRWSIDGTSLFGAPIAERFDWAAGRARWTSQAERGDAEASDAPLYISSDASPWALGHYARLLLKTPGGTHAVLPNGSLRLREARRITVGSGAHAIQVTAYELSGLRLEPDYVLLDDAGRLFGTLGGLAGGLVRTGYEEEARRLQDLGQEIALDRAQAAAAALAHRFTGPLRIRNVRVFDAQAGTLGPLSTVSIYGDRITGVEEDRLVPTAQDDATVIDGEGGVLLPGLHDMHSHTMLSQNLTNLAQGVTTTLDMGNDNARLLSWVGRLDTGGLIGPRIIRSGYLEGRSPFSARNGIIADTLADALQAVRWYADHGYWQIKIYNSVDPEWVRPIAAEAHRLGMGVSGHVPAFSSADRVIGEGFDTIAHVNQLMLGWLLEKGEDTRTLLRLTAMVRAKDLNLASAPVTKTIGLLKSHGVALDTTVGVYERLMLSRSDARFAADAPYIDHMPLGYQRAARRSFVPLDATHSDVGYRAAFAKVLALIAMLDTQGVPLLPGTDTESLFALDRELELYVAAGIAPSRALQLATLESARYLGREREWGMVERGKVADLVLVAGDPTRHIADVRNVRMTISRGVVYFPAEIYEWIGIRPFLTLPPVRTALKAP